MYDIFGESYEDNYNSYDESYNYDEDYVGWKPIQEFTSIFHDESTLVLEQGVSVTNFINDIKSKLNISPEEYNKIPKNIINNIEDRIENDIDDLYDECKKNNVPIDINNTEFKKACNVISKHYADALRPDVEKLRKQSGSNQQTQTQQQTTTNNKKSNKSSSGNKGKKKKTVAGDGANKNTKTAQQQSGSNQQAQTQQTAANNTKSNKSSSSTSTIKRPGLRGISHTRESAGMI